MSDFYGLLYNFASSYNKPVSASVAYSNAVVPGGDVSRIVTPGPPPQPASQSQAIARGAVVEEKRKQVVDKSAAYAATSAPAMKRKAGRPQGTLKAANPTSAVATVSSSGKVYIGDDLRIRGKKVNVDNITIDHLARALEDPERLRQKAKAKYALMRRATVLVERDRESVQKFINRVAVRGNTSQSMSHVATDKQVQSSDAQVVENAGARAAAQASAVNGETVRGAGGDIMKAARQEAAAEAAGVKSIFLSAQAHSVL